MNQLVADLTAALSYTQAHWATVAVVLGGLVSLNQSLITACTPFPKVESWLHWTLGLFSWAQHQDVGGWSLPLVPLRAPAISPPRGLGRVLSMIPLLLVTATFGACAWFNADVKPAFDQCQSSSAQQLITQTAPLIGQIIAQPQNAALSILENLLPIVGSDLVCSVEAVGHGLETLAAQSQTKPAPQSAVSAPPVVAALAKPSVTTRPRVAPAGTPTLDQLVAPPAATQLTTQICNAKAFCARHGRTW